jgi:FAD/FMN-containing dehydrogenase
VQPHEPAAGEKACPVFPGSRVLPADPRYRTLSRGFNQRFEGKPAYIEVCGSAEQVRAAVQLAVDHHLRITVRCGGHCYEDFVSGNTGGVIIDLAPLGCISRERDDLYGVDGGCTLWDLVRQLYRRFGVTLPAGTCSSVGVGGHVTGGGYGPLCRKHGLTVDYLAAVELVRVNKQGKAEIAMARRDAATGSERELLWAHCGGGGGNFGIVTRFWFKGLPPAPEEAYLVRINWDWKEINLKAFRHLLTEFGTFLEEQSGPNSSYKDLFSELHLNHQSAGKIGVVALHVGKETTPADDFVDRIKPPGVPLRLEGGDQGKPYGRRMPWLEATQTLNPSGDNLRSKHKGAFMRRRFPKEQIEVLWKFLTDEHYHNKNASLQIDSYGGQVNAVASPATAFPHRDSIMILQYQTHWPSARGRSEQGDGDDTNLEWIRKFYASMYGERGPYPDDIVDGTYVNFPDVDLKNWQYLYYKANYPRLQQVKKSSDPLNIFNHAQSVELPEKP